MPKVGFTVQKAETLKRKSLALKNVIRRGGGHGLPILKSEGATNLLRALDSVLDKRYQQELEAAELGLSVLRLRKRKTEYTDLYGSGEPYASDLPSQSSKWTREHMKKLGIKFLNDGCLIEWLNKPFSSLPHDLLKVAISRAVFTDPVSVDYEAADLADLVDLAEVSRLFGKDSGSLVGLYRLAAFSKENFQDSWIYKLLHLLGHHTIVPQMSRACTHGHGCFAVGIGAVLDFALCQLDEALTGEPSRIHVTCGVEDKRWYGGSFEDFEGQLAAELMCMKIGSGRVKMILTVGPLFYFIYGELKMTYCFAFDNGLKPGQQIFHYAGPLDMRKKEDRLLIFQVLYTDAL